MIMKNRLYTVLSVSIRYFGKVLLGLVEQSSVAVLEMDAMKR